jgi:hypothetical protein
MRMYLLQAAIALRRGFDRVVERLEAIEFQLRKAA